MWRDFWCFVEYDYGIDTTNKIILKSLQNIHINEFVPKNGEHMAIDEDSDASNYIEDTKVTIDLWKIERQIMSNSLTKLISMYQVCTCQIPNR